MYRYPTISYVGTEKKFAARAPGLRKFNPTFSLILACNHRPNITGQDTAIWRRIRLIPWEVTLPPEERRPQEEVIAELVADGSAVLEWLLAGLADWQRDRNWTALEVRAATARYRAEQDRLGAFLGECCEFAPLDGLTFASKCEQRIRLSS